MNKHSALPEYLIEGTAFFVDTDQHVLREVGNPQNEISFIRDMTDHGTHYRLTYNTVFAIATTSPPDGEWVREVSIPQLTQLDPQGMSAKYGIPLDQLPGKSDFEVIVNQEALARREAGILPQIDIAGENFTVDLRLRELRNTKYFFPVISMKSFELTDDGLHYTAFYEPMMKQVVNIDPKLLEFPEGIIAIRIPNETGLDPVATAQKLGLEPRELLRRYPIRTELKAELIPLAETHIPALIRRNKEQLQQDHAENMKKARPKYRHRL